MLSLENESEQTVNFNTKKVASVITVAAGVAAVGVIVSTQESNSGPKLALINIPKEFSGTFTNSHDDGRYTAEGIFHKFEHEDGDWQIDAKITAKGPAQSDTYYMVYTLKDDILLEETFNLTTDERMEVHCMEPQGFPTYGQGKEIFQKAVSVQENELTEDILKRAKENCQVGAELAVVSENTKQWVICGDYSNENFEMTLMGGQVTLHARAVEGMVVDIEYPEDYDLKAHGCTLVNDPIVRFADKILKGVEYEHRALEVKTHMWPYKKEETKKRNLSASPYACTQNVIKCMIFHGVANAGMNAWDQNWAYRWPEQRDVVYDVGGGYYGEGFPEGYDGVQQWNRVGDCNKCMKGAVYGARNFNFHSVRGCEYMTLMDTDTQLRGYNSEDLHTEYRWTLGSSGLLDGSHWSTDGDGRCGRLLRVASHSMGGMIMQMGLIRNVIERKGFLWFQVQNPWYGSFAANQAEPVCNAMRYLSHWTIRPLLYVPGVNAVVIASILEGTGVLTLPGALLVVAVLALVFAALLYFPIFLIMYKRWFQSWDFDTMAIGFEVCIKGHRLGYSSDSSFPLPANKTIEFHQPWKFQQGSAHHFQTDGTGSVETNSRGYYVMNQTSNKDNRRPNMRMCGNHPHGFKTGYEQSGVFKHVAKRLENIPVHHSETTTGETNQGFFWDTDETTTTHTYDIKKNYDIISDQSDEGRYNPRKWAKGNNKWVRSGQNAMHSNASGNYLAELYYTTPQYKGGEDLFNCGVGYGKSFWSDGAVDITNCLNYAVFTYDFSIEHPNVDAGVHNHPSNNPVTFIGDRIILNASNHDSGTCRSGKATEYDKDPCQIWEKFFTTEPLTYIASYHQHDDYFNGMWTPVGNWGSLFGSTWWTAGQTLDIWLGEGPPTVPPTPFPTPHPKYVDENGWYIGNTYTPPPPIQGMGPAVGVAGPEGSGSGMVVNNGVMGHGVGFNPTSFVTSPPALAFGAKGKKTDFSSGYHISTWEETLSQAELDFIDNYDPDAPMSKRDLEAMSKYQKGNSRTLDAAKMDWQKQEKEVDSQKGRLKGRPATKTNADEAHLVKDFAKVGRVSAFADMETRAAFVKASPAKASSKFSLKMKPR